MVTPAPPDTATVGRGGAPSRPPRAWEVSRREAAKLWAIYIKAITVMTAPMTPSGLEAALASRRGRSLHRDARGGDSPRLCSGEEKPLYDIDSGWQWGACGLKKQGDDS